MTAAVRRPAAGVLRAGAAGAAAAAGAGRLSRRSSPTASRRPARTSAARCGRCSTSRAAIRSGPSCWRTLSGNAPDPAPSRTRSRPGCAPRPRHGGRGSRRAARALDGLPAGRRRVLTPWPRTACSTPPGAASARRLARRGRARRGAGARGPRRDRRRPRRSAGTASWTRSWRPGSAAAGRAADDRRPAHPRRRRPARRRPRRRPGRRPGPRPGLVLFLGARDGRRAPTASAASTSTTTSWPGRSGSSPWRSSCSRAGWPRASTRSAPSSAPRSRWRSSARSSPRCITGLAGVVALRPHAARGPAARLDHRRHRRRGDLRAAARLDAAPPPGPHARGRGGLQRPGRRPARPRLHRLDPEPALRRRRHARCCSSQRARRRRWWSASPSAARRVPALRRVRLASAGLYPVASLAAAALAFGGADAAARLGLPGRLPVRAWRSAAPTIPARARSSTFHDGLAWVAQLAHVPHARACSCSPAASATSRSRARCSPSSSAVVARPLAAFVATAFGGFSVRGAARARLGRPARRGPGRPGHLPGDRAACPQASSSSTSSSSRSCVSTVLQGATFEPLARRLGVTTDEPALPAPLVEAGAVRRLGRRGRRVRGAPRATRSSAGRVRELGLPRDALLNLIVRGGQAIPPRGSTRHRGRRPPPRPRPPGGGGRVPRLLQRWRDGPARAAAPPRRPPRSTRPSSPSRPVDARRRRPRGRRRRRPGGHRAPADPARRPRRARRARGRPLRRHRTAARLGGSTAVRDAARRRLARRRRRRRAAWWREVIGALAAERPV